MSIIKAIEDSQKKTDLPKVDVGDHVKVHIRILEGNKERIQIFEGNVIAKKGSGIRETFTVRKKSYGVGIEKVLPLHSPKTERIEVIGKGKIRRAKLYYLRDRIGKAAKVKVKLPTKK